jgi:hypothetical protein
MSTAVYQDYAASRPDLEAAHRELVDCSAKLVQYLSSPTDFARFVPPETWEHEPSSWTPDQRTRIADMNIPRLELGNWNSHQPDLLLHGLGALETLDPHASHRIQGILNSSALQYVKAMRCWVPALIAASAQGHR